MIHKLKKIKLLKSNPNYRIGDVVLRQGYRWLRDSESILLNKKYFNTILFKYLNSLGNPLEDPFSDDSCTIPRGISDINSLKNICLEKKVETNKENLYIHIRSGDIVQMKHSLRQKFFLYDKDGLLDKIHSRIKFKKFKKIYFVTAMHFGDFKEKNLWMYSESSVNENISLLNSLFNEVSKIIDCDVLCEEKNSLENIDHHFCSLVSADNVILDQGGFSQVIKYLRA